MEPAEATTWPDTSHTERLVQTHTRLQLLRRLDVKAKRSTHFDCTAGVDDLTIKLQRFKTSADDARAVVERGRELNSTSEGQVRGVESTPGPAGEEEVASVVQAMYTFKRRRALALALPGTLRLKISNSADPAGQRKQKQPPQHHPTSSSGRRRDEEVLLRTEKYFSSPINVLNKVSGWSSLRPLHAEGLTPLSQLDMTLRKNRLAGGSSSSAGQRISRHVLVASVMSVPDTIGTDAPHILRRLVSPPPPSSEDADAKNSLANEMQRFHKEYNNALDSADRVLSTWQIFLEHQQHDATIKRTAHPPAAPRRSGPGFSRVLRH